MTKLNISQSARKLILACHDPANDSFSGKRCDVHDYLTGKLEGETVNDEISTAQYEKFPVERYFNEDA